MKIAYNSSVYDTNHIVKTYLTHNPNGTFSVNLSFVNGEMETIVCDESRKARIIMMIILYGDLTDEHVFFINDAGIDHFLDMATDDKYTYETLPKQISDDLDDEKWHDKFYSKFLI